MSSTTILDTGTVADPVAPPSFHDELTSLLPRLRIQALALTRNRADADDLVQAAIVNALAAQASFVPGTNLHAWVYRIMRNRFISDRRRYRPSVDMDDAPETAFARPAAQEDSIVLAELRRAMARLPADQRTALVMVSVQGMSYAEVAAVMRCAVGTAKCRVFRARQALHAALLGDVEAVRRRPSRRGEAGAAKGLQHSIAETGAGRQAPARGDDGRH